MTNRQKELIKLCGYKIVDNRLVGEKECISNIYYDDESQLFSIDMKAYNFKPGDYETVEMFSITLNHMLGLVYELNLIGNAQKCPICGEHYNGHPAISRKDNKTKICPNCGVGEAFLDFCENYKKTTF